MSNRDESRFDDDDIVALARTVEPHDFERIDPPPVVWNNILAELEVEVASQEASARRKNAWFSSTRILSIAAATLLMVGVAVAIVTLDGDDDAPNEVAAVMTDAGLPVSTIETADARVVCEDDQCFVELNLSGLPDAGADDLELWVINGDVTDMHSLGNVTATDGRFELPKDVTADDFPIVDISIEPDDGDETHSGQSVLRGTLS